MTSLNLSNNNLSAEDITFINGTNYPLLSNLTLRNPIYKMPDELATLSTLTYLNMSSCELRELADLTGLDQLLSLDLRYNCLLEKEIIDHVPVRFSSDSTWLTNTINPNYDPSTDEYYPENKRVITNDENGIPDAELYALLLERGDQMSGNSDGTLTVAEARRINYLTLTPNVKELTNLAKWTPNLHTLDLNNYITDNWIDGLNQSFYSELELLENLYNLNIYIYTTEDISAIITKTALTNLTVYIRNNAVDLSPFSTLKNIVSLQLYEIPQDIESSQLLTVINSFDNLKSLNLNGSFSAFQDIISDIEIPIKNKLTTLSLSGWGNTEGINPDYNFSEYSNLSDLNISSNFHSVSGLENLNNLRYLFLNNSTELAEIGDLPANIINLELSGIHLENLAEQSNILKLTNLYNLSITNGNLKNIAGISSLNQLQHLNLNSNQIESLEDLSQLTELVTLHLSHNQIRDISGMENLTNLRNLDLSNNQLTDISILGSMTWLYNLHLENNRIQELPDLTGLTELSKTHYYSDVYSNLVLSGNLLTQEAVVGKVPSIFTDNKVWLAQTVAAKPDYQYYYSSLDSNTFYQIITQGYSPAEHIHNSIYMKEDAQIECSAELFQILEEDDIRVNIYFANPDDGTIKTSYFIGKGRTKSDQQDIILKNLNMSVNEEEIAIARESFSEYGEIPIYFIKYPADTLLQDIPFDYSLGISSDTWNLNNVYFYNRAKNNIEILNFTLGNQESWSNYTKIWQDNEEIYTMLPERSRTSEEGFYFMVNTLYPFTYSNLDSDLLYDIITRGYDPAVNINTSVNIKENGQVECNSDLLQTFEKDNIQVSIIFGESKDHDTGIQFYLGNGRPANTQKGITLKKPDFTVDDSEKKIAENYFSEYGEIPIYYLKNDSFLPEQKVAYRYTIAVEEENWTSHSIYFYNRMEDRIEKLEGTIYGSQYINLTNYTLSYNTATNQTIYTLREDLNRSPEEGFYFIVNSKYHINSNNEGEYTDPKHFDGEYHNGYLTDINALLDEKITSASQGETITLAFSHYAYITAEVWNKSVDKKLNWEITQVDENGGLLSILNISAEDTYKVSENSQIGLSVTVSPYYTSDPTLNELLQGHQAASVSIGALSKKAELTTFVGNLYKNGEELELYFYNYETVMSGNNSKVTVEESGIAPMKVSYGMITFTIEGRNSNMLLVNGKLDLNNNPDEPDKPDVPDEPDTPDVPDEPIVPDEPDTPDVPDEPIVPDEPDTPDVPDEPIVPDEPDTPDVPDEPIVPDEPDTPDVPDEPIVPDEPDTPDVPDIHDVPDEQPSKPIVIDKNQIVSADNTNNTLVDKMNGLRKDVQVVVEKKENEPLTLAKDVFDNMLAKRKNVSVSVVNDKNEMQYGWTFPIDDSRVDPSKFADIDLSIQFNTDKKEEIEAITGQTNSLYLEFAHHGDLPIPATIKNYVGDTYKDGEIVYLYYFNQEHNKVEAIKDANGRMGLTVENGYVTYTITHCSIYFLASEKPEELGVSIEDQSEQPQDQEKPSGDDNNMSDKELNEETSQTEEKENVANTSYVKSPLTGESSREINWMMLLALLGLSCAAICLKKSKEK